MKILLVNLQRICSGSLCWSSRTVTEVKRNAKGLSKCAMARLKSNLTKSKSEPRIESVTPVICEADFKIYTLAKCENFPGISLCRVCTGHGKLESHGIL